MEKILFVDPDTEEEVEFYIVEQTKFQGANYLLVTETDDDEEADAYILKDISSSEDKEANYVLVEDDKELEAVSDILSQLLEDVSIEH